MSDSLSVLIIEESEDNVQLMLSALRSGGINVVWECVETGEVLRKMLVTRRWDVILSAHVLSHLDASAALAIVQQSQRDIPFILVSGAIGERLVVDLIKAGAHDYVRQDDLARLPEVVQREIQDSRARADQKQKENLLRRQLTAMEKVMDGIAILEGGIYLYVNRAHLTLFGYETPEELVGKTWRCLYSPEQVDRFEQDIFPIVKRDRFWQGEAIATRQDGSTFEEGVSLTLTEDDMLICVCRDISIFKQAQAQVIHDALHDPLTGLPNRTLLTERLGLAINRGKRTGDYRYAVLFLDLDRFKAINDGLGHMVGDQLLIAISQRLKARLRETDLVARLGGDEFVILLEDIIGTETVVQITERILADCETPFLINSNEIFTRFSIGIVLGDRNYRQASDLIRDADTAMYRAKAQANHSYKFFDSTMQVQSSNRSALEYDLHQALLQQQFRLHYQPIIDLTHYRLMGFEALVRWQHPTRGLLFPKEFVPIAEETGLIVHLDNWVLSQACQQLSLWAKDFPDCFPFTISINLSTQDLRSASLIQTIDHHLADTGLSGDVITVEIAESMLMDDAAQAIDLLTQVTSRRIKISIDNFGTGYSSLHSLHRLPLNHLKIDRSFVNQMRVGNHHHQMVKTMMTLSQQLGLSVIAEGIETPHQLEQLQQLGCPFGQGDLFSPPLPVYDAEAKFLQNAWKGV